MPSFMREVMDALLPDGAAWKPAYGGDYDKLLDGVSQNAQGALDDLASLEHIRNPYKCPTELLPDLEREFGISPNNALTEKTRRASLATVRYKRGGLATVPKLQRALDLAGFGYGGYGLSVTQNASPPANPEPIVEANYVLTAHEFPSVYCAGNSRAFAGGGGGGYYLTSGDYFTSRPLYPQAGRICARAFDGSDYRSGLECAGYYDEMLVTDENLKYKSPPEGYWSLVFFVGGAVTRNPDGRIATIATVNIPQSRRQELHRLILRVKPCGIWAAMMVDICKP
jgi:hypothetical protein